MSQLSLPTSATSTSPPPPGWNLTLQDHLGQAGPTLIVTPFYTGWPSPTRSRQPHALLGFNTTTPQLLLVCTHIPRSKGGRGRRPQTFLAHPLRRFLATLAEDQAPLLQRGTASGPMLGRQESIGTVWRRQGRAAREASRWREAARIAAVPARVRVRG